MWSKNTFTYKILYEPVFRESLEMFNKNYKQWDTIDIVKILESKYFSWKPIWGLDVPDLDTPILQNQKRKCLIWPSENSRILFGRGTCKRNMILPSKSFYCIYVNDKVNRFSIEELDSSSASSLQQNCSCAGGVTKNRPTILRAFQVTALLLEFPDGGRFP